MATVTPIADAEVGEIPKTGDPQTLFRAPFGVAPVTHLQPPTARSIVGALHSPQPAALLPGGPCNRQGRTCQGRFSKTNGVEAE